MTDRLTEIRARWEQGSLVRGDVASLFTALDDRDREIERLTRERDALRCPTCRGDGYIGGLEYDGGGATVDGRDRCPDCDDGTVSYQAAFRAGADAMREACAVQLRDDGLLDTAREIEALPIPEAKR